MQITEQLALLAEIKEDIKNAIQSKGVTVLNSYPFSSYPGLIETIKKYVDNLHQHNYANRTITDNLNVVIPAQLNITNVGGVAIDSNYIASGFASGKYLSMPQAFSPSVNDNWEIVFKFKFVQSSSYQQLVKFAIGVTASSSYALQLYINTTGNICYSEAASSSSWVSEVSGSTVLSNNTIYYVKLVGNGLTRTCYSSTDGDNWMQEFTTTPSQIYTGGYNYNFIGLSYRDNTYNTIMAGLIYLQDCYIIKNNQLWWQGVTPEQIIL